MGETLFISTHHFRGVALRIASTSLGVCRIDFDKDNGSDFEPWAARYFPQAERVEDAANHEQAVDELARYFGGELKIFRTALDMRGTEFQRKVWRYLVTIPYGQTRSYLDVARAIGSPGSIRAVGAANGANPVSIIVPCHRVIGSDGSLTGYGGGLDLKRRLLALEGVPLSGGQRAFEFAASKDKSPLGNAPDAAERA